jgi:hypothetical protein
VHARPALLVVVLALLLPAAAAAALIQGGPRAETLRGTPKADRIDALFGGVDRVLCRGGVDIVNADASDSVSSDCEFVSRVVSTDTLGSAPGQHATEVEPSAAANGSTVVATFQVGRFRDGGAAGVGWATSANAGRTWRSGILPGVTQASPQPGDAPRASDPSVAYDAAHRTWLISTLVLGDRYTALGISRSDDGLAWSAPVTAARTPTASLGYDKEWVGCDNAASSPYYGSCYLVYTDIAMPRVALQVSHDGGATWGAPVAVTSAFGSDAEGALPLVQPGGALTVVFLAGEAGMYAVRSTDGGATFGPYVGIAPLDQSQQPLLRAPSLPTAAVDASGRLYVAWADCQFRRGCDGNSIVLTSSLDGSTWTDPTRVPGTGFDSFVPALAADPRAAGRLGLVTYVRTSNSCNPFTCSIGVSVTRSRDGGGTWTKPQRLDAVPARYPWLAPTDEGQFVGDYTGATFAAGRLVPVYALASPPLGSTRLREFMLAASLS